jgi:hypothetical protein
MYEFLNGIALESLFLGSRPYLLIEVKAAEGREWVLDFQTGGGLSDHQVSDLLKKTRKALKKTRKAQRKAGE